MTAESDGYLSHRQIMVVMSGLMVGMFLAALDQSILGTALPKITSDLGGFSKLSCVVTSYLLASTASTPLWGRSRTSTAASGSSRSRSSSSSSVP